MTVPPHRTMSANSRRIRRAGDAIYRIVLGVAAAFAIYLVLPVLRMILGLARGPTDHGRAGFVERCYVDGIGWIVALELAAGIGVAFAVARAASSASAAR